jgi:hypothetical protein
MTDDMKMHAVVVSWPYYYDNENIQKKKEIAHGYLGVVFSFP